MVLRHQLAVSRCQVAHPRLSWSDRALIATVAKLVPRECWSAFLVMSETILRWHRALVRRRWTLWVPRIPSTQLRRPSDIRGRDRQVGRLFVAWQHQHRRCQEAPQPKQRAVVG